MYNKIVKNNQVTYGVPFQLKVHPNIHNIRVQEEAEAESREETAAAAEPDAADIILKAREEAELITREAEYEAARIIESAENEARVRAGEIEEEARKRGYFEGTEKARQQNEALLLETREIRDNAIEAHDRTLALMENEIIEMTLEIARKVIGYELRENRENMLLIVQQALNRCSNRNNMIVKVSKDDYESLEDEKDKLLSKVQGVSGLEIRQDLSLKQGDCIVETPFGSVDAGVDTKLNKIEEAFRQLLDTGAAWDDGLAMEQEEEEQEE